MKHMSLTESFETEPLKTESLEAAIAALEQKHFRRGKYNPQLGAVEWWNEQYDLAIILHNCQGFVIKTETTFSKFFKRKRLEFSRKRPEGEKTMITLDGGDNDNEPTPQEIAQQESRDEAFKELVEVVTENSGEAGRDQNWE